MSREEDLIRSTALAIASAVREVPPLRLEASADEIGTTARAARSRHAAGRMRDATRRWRAWLVPATAAAVVAAVAIVLVNVRSIKDDSAVSKTAAASASASAAGPVGTVAPSGPAGVPPYYVALTQTNTAGNGSKHNGILVGETGTGKTLKTFPSPAHTVFASVTAAADDRTFVVFAVTSGPGSQNGPTPGGHWYEVRLVPGSADPVRMAPLPIEPELTFTGAGPEQGFVSVLSGSGQELAVTDEAVAPFAVKVYSVATGRLLRSWTTNDQSYFTEPSLAWINGDRDLVLVSHVLPGPQKAGTTIWTWPVKDSPSGDLAAVSKVVWKLPLSKSPTPLQVCVNPVGTPLISADGRTFSCAAYSISAAGEPLSFRTYQLATIPAATEKGTVDYQVTHQGMRSFYRPAVLWTSPSGDKIIGSITASAMSPGAYAGRRVGVISHGRFVPLNLPANVIATAAGAIAF